MQDFIYYAPTKVYFGKNKERISDKVTISGKAYEDDNIIYTVCGLSEGEWQITGAGKKTSTKEGGVVSFTAPQRDVHV